MDEWDVQTVCSCISCMPFLSSQVPRYSIATVLILRVYPVVVFADLVLRRAPDDPVGRSHKIRTLRTVSNHTGAISLAHVHF